MGMIDRRLAELGITLSFEGKGLDEIAVVKQVTSNHAPGVKPGQVIMRIDARYFRPADVKSLLGDATKAREKLGWEPTSTLRELCAEMVSEDVKIAKRYALLKHHGLEQPVSMGT